MLPPGCTIIALPYVSKIGFCGPTVQALVTSILNRDFTKCKFLFLGDHSQVQARNNACKDAISEGADWLLFLDSDMDWPPDTLQRLKACDSDVACSDMWARNWPSFRTVLRNKDKDENGWVQSAPVDGWPEGIEDVDVCGMACTLIKVSFLKRFQDHYKDQPWFWAARHGEDATFCFNAKAIGASIRCDFSIVAGHWGVTRMAGQDYTRDARNQPMAVAEEAMMKRMGALNLPEGANT